MPAPYRPPPSGPLADLIRSREIAFHQGIYLRSLRFLVLEYLEDSEDPGHVIEMHRGDFFLASCMYHEAWRHDRETRSLWLRKSGGRNCSAAEQAKFFERRMQIGICRIKEKTGFDLARPVPAAFKYYRTRLMWLLLRLLRKRKKIRLVSLDGDDAWLLPWFFDPDPTDPERWAIVTLAMVDLPTRQRMLARDVAHDAEFERSNGTLLKAIDVMREYLHVLFLAHDLAQSLDGRNFITRAARLLIKKNLDASLVTDHFAVAGPACAADLFAGLPLDDLATAAERMDPSGDKVRFRLLRALAEISAVIDRSGLDALLSLPRAQRSLLKLWLFQMELNATDEHPPAMTPAEKERKIREAFRDFRRLRELYRRGRSRKKNRHDLIHHKLLTSAERDLLERHLVNKETLEKIAESSRTSVEAIKENLLAVATKVVKLKK